MLDQFVKWDNETMVRRIIEASDTTGITPTDVQTQMMELCDAAVRALGSSQGLNYLTSPEAHRIYDLKDRIANLNLKG